MTEQIKTLSNYYENIIVILGAMHVSGIKEQLKESKINTKTMFIKNHGLF